MSLLEAPEQPSTQPNKRMTTLRIFAPEVIFKERKCSKALLLAQPVFLLAVPACKDQNDLRVRNEHSKAALLISTQLNFIKLGFIELRKFFGYTSASKRDGLR
jgi:hypothetical protein